MTGKTPEEIIKEAGCWHVYLSNKLELFASGTESPSDLIYFNRALLAMSYNEYKSSVTDFYSRVFIRIFTDRAKEREARDKRSKQKLFK